MCVNVSLCACVFNFADVFLYGYVCVWVKSKTFLCVRIKSVLMGNIFKVRLKEERCGLIKVHTHGKFCGLCKSYCLWWSG